MKLINTKAKIHQHGHETTVIKIEDLVFGFNRNSTQLKKISLNIHRGEWTTVLGPNGSGKSTLAKNIVRILKAREGSIYVEGKLVSHYKNKEFAQKVAYIPQMIEIPEGTSVYDYVSFGRNPWLGFSSKMTKEDHAIVKQALEKTGAWEWKDKVINDLSGGQRQRVVVSMAIAQTADIIILDEPTTYLDIRAQYELLELLYTLHMEGKTIIAILHDINQAVQYSDDIIILKEGAIYSVGSPSETITENMLREVYGVETKLYQDDDRKYLTDIKLVQGFNQK